MSTAPAPSAREGITRRIAELDELLDGSAGAPEVVTLDQQRVGRLSRMDAMQASAMAGATVARRAREKRRLRQALGRLDAGSYGECLDCGGHIAEARLAIDPAAERCIACATVTD